VKKKKETRPPRASRKPQQQQFATHFGSSATIVVHLSNGTRLQGVVLSVDSYILLLGKNPDDQFPVVVYKHAITLIAPAGRPGESLADPDPAASPDFVPVCIVRTRKRR